MFLRSFNNKKTIIFQESSLVAKHFVDKPVPASNKMPKWYKNEKLYSHGNNNIVDHAKYNSHGTYKLCVPLVDSMSSGYTIELSATIVITNSGSSENYIPKVNWNVDWNVCDTLDSEALQKYPIPYQHHNQCFRWYTEWIIKTPKNYSLWVTHPSHRYDLPFTTINGFVDSDRHYNRLILPFFIQNGFEGIIERGTPIAQIIPIKRDNWVSKKQKAKDDSYFITTNNVKIDYERGYKKLFWSKKRYG